MQLKLQELQELIMDEPPALWYRLDPDTQKAVVKALSGTTVNAIVQKAAEQESKREEGTNE
jgi:hypothetical protein